MGRKRRPQRRIKQVLMGLAKEAQRTGDHDVGMGDIGAEPPGSPCCPIRFQGIEDAGDLGLTPLNPEFGGTLMDHTFIDQADGLVGQATGQGTDLQRRAPLQA